MECYFAIDKEKSLDIIRSIQATTKTDDSDDWPNCYKHKLQLIQICVDSDPTRKVERIEDVYDIIVKNSHSIDNLYGYPKDEYFIKIRDIEIELDGRIVFDAFTEIQGSDWGYTPFTYDEHLKTWIIRDKYWDAESGLVDGDDYAIILDFNNYKD